jgi:hypothetical protein
MIRRRGWGWALAALALAGWGCSQKGTTEPEAGPAGVQDGSRARLVVWADSSSLPGIGSTLIVHLGVLDFTSANTYALWRQEPSGGYRLVKDFSAAAVSRFISQDAEYYRFFDLPATTLADTIRYIAQGGINGAYGSYSPLSNTAAIPKALTPPDDSLVVVFPRDSVATDSMPTLQWRQLPGVAGYIVQIYQPRRDVKDTDIFPESRPQVIYEKSHNFLVAFIPAATAIAAGALVTYRVRLGSAAPATLYEARLPMLALQVYRWRIVAVTAEGRIRSVNASYQRPYIEESTLKFITAGFNVYNARRPPP